MHRRKPFLFCTAALVIVVIVSCVGVPPLLRAVANRKLSQALGRSVTIGKVTLNPLRLSVQLDGIAVTEPGRTELFFSCASLRVNLEALSAFRRGIIVSEISLDQPYLRLIRRDDGNFNYADLLAEKPSSATAPDEAGPLRFSLNNISVTGGRIDFDDRPRKARHALRDINLTLPFISNFDSLVDTFVEPSFSARLNDRPIVLTGKSKPFADSLETSLTVSLQQLNISPYLSLIPAELHVTVPSCLLDTDMTLSYINKKGRAPRMQVRGAVRLSEVQIRDARSQPLFALPQLRLDGIDCDINSRTLHIDGILLSGLETHIKYADNGTLNLTELVAAPSAGEQSPEDTGAAAGAQRAWNVTVSDFRCDNGTVTFEDRSRPHPVTIKADRLQLQARNITTAENKQGDVEISCRLNEAGTLELQGRTALNPPAAELSVNLHNIDISPVQGYLDKYACLRISDGQLAVQGTLAVRSSAAGEAAVACTGDISLSRFAALGCKHAETVCRLDALTLAGVEAGSDPLFVKIASIGLHKPQLRLVLDEGAQLNVNHILRSDNQTTAVAGAVTAPSAAPGPADQFHVDRVTITGGRIQFHNKAITPPYSAELSSVSAEALGLSTLESQPGSISLSAVLDGYAPLEMTGTFKPFLAQPCLDTRIDFKNIEMSPFSSFSARYIGRQIEKGLLSLSLAYRLADGSISAQNNIFMDQFTLGGRVESPDAFTLPVELAVALLKNRRGQIHIDLPVTGRLDDPTFRLGNVLLQVLKNVIQKAVTSPFALLGRLAGGEEELNYVQFDNGTAGIPEQGKKKLAALAEALYERPALKLEIEGCAAPGPDTRGLQELLFLRALKARKLEDMLNNGQTGLTVDQVEIAPEEYERYLGKAYRAAAFEKETNMLGLERSLSPEEMERLLRAHITVGDAELMQLMLQRALAAKQYLTETGKVDAQRIFIIDPKPPGEQPGNERGRALFRLK